MFIQCTLYELLNQGTAVHGFPQIVFLLTVQRNFIFVVQYRRFQTDWLELALNFTALKPGQSAPNFLLIKYQDKYN